MNTPRRRFSREWTSPGFVDSYRPLGVCVSGQGGEIMSFWKPTKTNKRESRAIKRNRRHELEMAY